VGWPVKPSFRTRNLGERVRLLVNVEAPGLQSRGVSCEKILGFSPSTQAPKHPSTQAPKHPPGLKPRRLGCRRAEALRFPAYLHLKIAHEKINSRERESSGMKSWAFKSCESFPLSKQVQGLNGVR